MRSATSNVGASPPPAANIPEALRTKADPSSVPEHIQSVLGRYHAQNAVVDLPSEEMNFGARLTAAGIARAAELKSKGVDTQTIARALRVHESVVYNALSPKSFGPPDADEENGDRAEAGRQGTSHMLNIDEPASQVNPGAQDRDPRAVEQNRMKRWLQARIDSAEVSGVVSETVTLTPVLAALLIERNPANRTLSENTVEKYARDMQAGRWVCNGEPIIISKEGLLNDGQHRCHAVLRSMRNVSVVMVFGVARETRFTVDQGLGRTVGHFLAMQGKHYSNDLAAAATLLWQYQTKGMVSDQMNDRPSSAEALAIADKYVGLEKSIEFVRSVPHKPQVVGPSVLAFCHFVFSGVAGDAAATEFIRDLMTGAGLTSRDPLLHARNRLLADKERYVTQARMTRAAKVELIFRTWNMRRRRIAAKKSPALMGGKLPAVER